MRVLMLNPPYLPRFSRPSRSPSITKGGTFYYPYYLAYATGVLEESGYKVKLVDAVANEWGREETIEFVKKFKPELIVMDTSTPSIYNDMEIANILKKELGEGVHICLVGTHVTAMSEWTLKNCMADSVCIGEYDYTVRDLAGALENGKSLQKVKGIAYKERNKILRTEKRELIKNLDELPWVSEVYKRQFGKKGILKYFYASLLWPEVTILTARGCPFNCSFCPIPFKHSYRARSVKDVLDEFEFIQNELPYVKEVMIEDDTFPVSKHRTIEFCKEKIRRGIKLTWSCNARVDTDFETLKWMKKAECRLLCVGFESPEQQGLDAVNKRTTKKMQEKFMKYTKILGLLVNGCFILGLPGETTKSVRKTIEFAKKLNCDTAQFYPLMVYPGTRAYEWAKENGYLETEDFSRWITEEGLLRTTVSRPELPSEFLNFASNFAYKAYYFRARYIFSKTLQLLLYPREAVRIFRSFYTLSKRL